MLRSRSPDSAAGGPGQRGRQRRRVPGAVWCLCGLLVCLAACSLAGLRLNLTGSMPVGIYITARGGPTRGSIVLVCLPPAVAESARERGYLPGGGSCPGHVVPVGKPVLGLPGDTVVVSAAGLLVNGEIVLNSKPLTSDHWGRLLPRMPAGRYFVGPGELWLVSDYSPFSFDSRYFGAIKARDVRGHVRALWTDPVLSETAEPGSTRP